VTAIPADREQLLIDFVNSAACRIWQVGYSALSRPEQVFLLVWELEGQVNNGGFWQYFWNDTGYFAPEAASALREIGDENAAAVVEQAIAVIGQGVDWQNTESRRRRVEAISADAEASLDALYTIFRAYPDDLTTLLYRHVCRHREQIGAPASFIDRR
jgi:hypothetical protein